MWWYQKNASKGWELSKNIYVSFYRPPPVRQKTNDFITRPLSRNQSDSYIYIFILLTTECKSWMASWSKSTKEIISHTRPSFSFPSKYIVHCTNMYQCINVIMVCFCCLCSFYSESFISFLGILLFSDHLSVWKKRI